MGFATIITLLVFIGVLGLPKNPRYAWLAVGALLLVITPIALPGFWPNGQWGISDWDYYFSYHTSIQRMVSDYGLFPQWNPYICGGTSAIGDPEFPLFAPTFFLELIFGIPLGFRLAIFSVTAFGAVGMLLLARRLSLSPVASFLAALAFSFGSINLLEIVEGHPNVFSAFYLPWIFWAWITAYDRSTKHETQIWSLLCGIFLALTFFQGGIYMLMYVSFAFLFLILALSDRFRSLHITIIAGLWALGLAAIKLVPVLFWLRQFQDKAYASSTYLIPSLHKILLGRFLHGSENVIPNQGGGWHEYGAYLGIIILAAALLSLLKLKQGRIRVLWGGALLAMLIASAGPVLKPLFDIAPFLPRSNISRFMILAIVPLSLLSAFGLEVLQPKRRWAPLVAALIVAAAAYDLTSYAVTLSKQTFVLNPAPSVSHPPTPIAYTINQHITRLGEVDYTRAYAGARAGYGTLSYCSVLGPEPSVRVIEDPEGSPYLVIPSEKGTAKVISWSPNQIIINATASKPAELILNANYARGWVVKKMLPKGITSAEPAKESHGRLMTPLTTGQQTVTFTYKAPGLWPGRTITVLTVLLAGIYLLILLYHKVRQPRA